MPKLVIIGLLYLIFRVTGKMIGAPLGAKITEQSGSIEKLSDCPVIYELIGPLCTKDALQKAGEIQTMDVLP